MNNPIKRKIIIINLIIIIISGNQLLADIISESQNQLTKNNQEYNINRHFEKYSHLNIIKNSNQNNLIKVVGIGENNYSNIQAAINDANEGDIVYISSGIYYENIIIDKSISLIGENKENTIIDGSHNDSVIKITEESVLLTGFTIQNSGEEFFDKWNSGIEIYKTDNCKIIDNLIINNYVGIYINQGSFSLILNNTIFSNYLAWDGIICEYSSHVSIVDNIIGHDLLIGRDAIYITQSNENYISNNKISNHQNGMRFYRSNYNYISDNYIAYNDLFGIQMQYCSDNDIQNNILKNSSYGLFFEYVPKAGKNYVFLNDFIDNYINSFFIILDSGGIIWNGNYWNKPHFFPKPIFGIYRDSQRLIESQHYSVIFDIKPSKTRNNEENKFISYDIEKLSNLNESPKIKQIEFDFEDTSFPDNMSIGDLLFMDCNRYTPFHTRPGKHSDHVSMYIGRDPNTGEPLLVETVDTTGPRICTFDETRRWAHNFAYGRVKNATNQQKLGAVNWAKQLCFDRNRPITSNGERIYDNYQYLPYYFDRLGFWKSYRPDGIEVFSKYWYCSELVWASYYNIDENGDIDLFMSYNKRIDLDPDGWLPPPVVLPLEVLNDDDIEIFYIDED
jgi:parallel beta-helix repeat protein